MPDESPAVYRADYRPPTYWVNGVHLEFDLHDQQTLVRATIDFVANPTSTERTLYLDGEDLKLLELRLDGTTLGEDAYVLDGQGLTLKGVPESFRLETLVEVDPDGNTELSGLYRSSGNFCTQCEAMGFRRITFYPDRPDVMAPFTVTIRADAQRYPVLLSNGNRVSQQSLDDGRHQVVWEDPYPKPSYLFALVAGDLQCHAGQFTTSSGREVRLEIWVEPQNADRCEHALVSLQKAMKWDEEVFGLEYDLDIYMIVAVNDFNMGAMENKGLNIFNSKYVLARPDTATDDDYELIEAIVAHEYFHNWTGNRVTCRDWFQLTLKEGLTVFRDQQFTADMTSAAVKRIEDVKRLRMRQFPEDEGPMAHPIRPESYVSMDNFYTATVYDKGAEVIRMYHTLLGADGFRRGMDLYFQRHDGQAVTCDDFRQAMADANQTDLSQLELWYSQAGTPELHVRSEWDEERQEVEVTLEQRYAPHAYQLPGTQDRKPLLAPVAVGLMNAFGESLETRRVDLSADVDSCESDESLSPGALPQQTHVLPLCQTRESYRFGPVAEAPILSVLRGYSAPMKLKLERGRRQLALLMGNDSDPFCRWDASQELAMQVLLELIANVQGESPLHLDPVFVEAFGSLLVDPELDGSFKSLLMTMPGESVVALEMETIDPDAIHAAHRFLRGHLAAIYQSQLVEIYRQNRRDEPYRNDRASIQRRRLKNTALGYLTTLEDPEFTALARVQFRTANNMTDQQAALAALNQQDVQEREEVLHAFYEQWRNDPLVLDKWFAVQASSDLSGTVDRVRALTEHPDFHWKNPNRVRALIGTFGMSNQVQFHQADGAGYELLTDMVWKVDEMNPQVAARLVSPLNGWKRFGPQRQGLMTQQLERLLAKPKLSKDVGEIVARALGR